MSGPATGPGDVQAAATDTAGYSGDDRGYKVRLENFEGPLDLLLYLIKREEVNIYDIPIARITEQYLVYIGDLSGVDIDRAAEYLVMAATLLNIKSRLLLPKPPAPPPEEEEWLSAEDPRAELVRQLVLYSRYKEAAAELKKMEQRQKTVYSRQGEVLGALPRPLAGVSLAELVAAFQEVIKEAWHYREIPRQEIPLRDRIRAILGQLRSSPAGVSFRELFADAASRLEIVVTFLALLELMRLRRVVAEQSATFGEIIIRRPLTPVEG